MSSELINIEYVEEDGEDNVLAASFYSYNDSNYHHHHHQHGCWHALL